MTRTAEEVWESVARIPQEIVASQPSVLVAGGMGRGAHPVSLWASLKGRDDVTVAALPDERVKKRAVLLQQAPLEGRKTHSYLLPVYADAGYSRGKKVQGLTWNKLATVAFSAAWLA